MTTILFVALATPDAQGGYRATFPDLPECAVQAPDLAGLLLGARQALAAHLQQRADSGETWPKPTPIEQLSLTPGLIPVLVDVTVEDTPVRVNISIGERLLQRLDAAAAANGASPRNSRRRRDGCRTSCGRWSVRSTTASGRTRPSPAG